jgi:hypothetical protein
MFSTLPYFMQGFVVEREKVAPAVGIEFIIEEKVINLSGSYLLCLMIQNLFNNQKFCLKFG